MSYMCLLISFYHDKRSIQRLSARYLAAYINAAWYSCKVNYDFFIYCMNTLIAVNVSLHSFASIIQY